MVSTVGLGLEMAYKGWSVELNMGAQRIIRGTTRKTMGLFQWEAMEVARQWVQEKTDDFYEGRNRGDYKKIKKNFFSPPLM